MSKREREKSLARKEKKKNSLPSAKLSSYRISPRKMRLVSELIVDKQVEEALAILTFTKKKAAYPLRKLIDSAVANADSKGGYDIDALYIKRVRVDEGKAIKRYMPRALGRAFPIKKRSSHVEVFLEERS